MTSQDAQEYTVEPAIEEAVVLMAFEQPAFGQQRACNELRKKGIFLSAAGVRCVWQRHDLEIFPKRLKALEARVAQDGIILTEAQMIALERKKEKREAIGEIEHPGYLGAQDTYYVGNIKGVGRIYQQTFIDTYSRVAFAKLYTSKHAITSADLLNDRVLPFFEEQQIPLLGILTDRGTEYKGKPEHHEYELYLNLEGIEHSKTQVRHPQTNGICERLHRTMQEEFYAIAFRTKLYDNRIPTAKYTFVSMHDEDSFVGIYTIYVNRKKSSQTYKTDPGSDPSFTESF